MSPAPGACLWTLCTPTTEHAKLHLVQAEQLVLHHGIMACEAG